MAISIVSPIAGLSTLGTAEISTCAAVVELAVSSSVAGGSVLGTVGASTCVSVVESVVELVELIVAPVTDAIVRSSASGSPISIFSNPIVVSVLTNTLNVAMARVPSLPPRPARSDSKKIH